MSGYSTRCGAVSFEIFNQIPLTLTPIVTVCLVNCSSIMAHAMPLIKHHLAALVLLNYVELGTFIFVKRILWENFWF